METIAMKNKVLSIEQMHELEELGIDTSNAPMCWITKKDTGKYDIRVNHRAWKDIYPKNYYDVTPTFTLQDILDMLPQGFYIEKNTTSLDKKVFLQINKTPDGGYNIAYEQSWDENGKLKMKIHGQQLNESLLKASFDMLKWCKQNNYI